MYSKLAKGERIYIIYKTKQLAEESFKKIKEINETLHEFVDDMLSNEPSLNFGIVKMKIILETPYRLPTLLS